MNTPRLGHIHFLNVLPLTYGLNTLNLKDGIQLKNGLASDEDFQAVAGEISPLYKKSPDIFYRVDTVALEAA